MSGLKFILPDWDDIVDPDFDFVNEKSSEGYVKDKYVHGARIWDLLGNDAVDGVLISISTISPRKMRRILSEGGARNFLRLPDNMQLIGDCGAWQYKDKDVPPYNVEEVLDYYNRLGVDYGVTLDHIPFFGNPQERMRITQENAIRMYNLWKNGDYKFVLMASVQGVEVGDYMNSMDKLYNVGYRHFAIGGLAKRDTEFIKSLINELIKYVKSKRDIEKIHFLGITRLTIVPILRELTNYVNEVSFDSSTVLRIAWTREYGNYITIDGKAYTVIRVLDNGKEVLNALRRYDRGELGLEEVITVLRNYLSRIGQTHYLPYYEALLRDMPWKKCDCAICRSAGIEVVIFRGNDRNRRRGFHNVYVFKKILSLNNPIRFTNVKVASHATGGSSTVNNDTGEILRRAERVLVITSCTAEKNVNWVEVLNVLRKSNLKVPSFDIELEDKYRNVLSKFIKPAREMYGGTFRAIRNLANKLRALGKQVDVYIISARYGLINENDLVIPYEATLKGLRKEDIERWSRKLKIEPRLNELLGTGNYDVIIVALPREYAIAMGAALDKLLNMDNVILILPKSILHESSNIKAKVLVAGSVNTRLKQIKQLMNSLENNNDNKKVHTLDTWLL